MGIFLDKLKNSILQKQIRDKEIVEEKIKIKECNPSLLPVKLKLEALATELNSESSFVQLFGKARVFLNEYEYPCLFTGDYLLGSISEEYIESNYIQAIVDLNRDDEFEITTTLVNGETYIPVSSRNSSEDTIPLKEDLKFEDKIMDIITEHMANNYRFNVKI